MLPWCSPTGCLCLSPRFIAERHAMVARTEQGRKRIGASRRSQTGPRDYSDWARRPMCLLTVRRIVRGQRRD